MLTAVMAFPSWTCIALSNSWSFSSLERNTSKLYGYNQQNNNSNYPLYKTFEWILGKLLSGMELIGWLKQYALSVTDSKLMSQVNSKRLHCIEHSSSSID